MRKLKTKRNYKKLKPIHESLGEDSSDDDTPPEMKKGSLTAILGSKGKKVSSRFKTSLKKVKKNAYKDSGMPREPSPQPRAK